MPALWLERPLQNGTIKLLVHQGKDRGVQMSSKEFLQVNWTPRLLDSISIFLPFIQCSSIHWPSLPSVVREDEQRCMEEREEHPFPLYWTLTHISLAVKDFESIMHASSQQQVLTCWVPLQPPNSTLNMGVCQWLLHIPGVPQENVFIIAGNTPQINMHRQKRNFSAYCTEGIKKMQCTFHHAPLMSASSHKSFWGSSHGLQIMRQVGDVRSEHLEITHLPVARRYSRCGLHWMLHTPIECLQRNNMHSENGDQERVHTVRRQFLLFSKLESSRATFIATKLLTIRS